MEPAARAPWRRPRCRSGGAARLCLPTVLCLAAAACGTHTVRSPAVVSATPESSTNGSAAQKQLAAVLGLSVGEGPAGTRVVLTVTGCLPRPGKPDQIIWEDSAELNGAAGHREVVGIQRTGTELHATFTVLPTDPAGQGILDATCGGTATHASATFTVVGP
jgi:hypothetical protein